MREFFVLFLLLFCKFEIISKKKKERENRKIGEYSKKQVLHFYLSIGFSGKKERESV